MRDRLCGPLSCETDITQTKNASGTVEDCPEVQAALVPYFKQDAPDFRPPRNALVDEESVTLRRFVWLVCRFWSMVVANVDVTPSGGRASGSPRPRSWRSISNNNLQIKSAANDALRKAEMR